jgi:hypothetical protein
MDRDASGGGLTLGTPLAHELRIVGVRHVLALFTSDASLHVVARFVVEPMPGWASEQRKEAGIGPLPPALDRALAARALALRPP